MVGQYVESGSQEWKERQALTCFVGHILSTHILGILTDPERQGRTNHTTQKASTDREKGERQKPGQYAHKKVFTAIECIVRLCVPLKSL